MPVPLWRRYLTFLKPDVSRDVDDELRFHLEERVGDLVAEGLTRTAADQQARAEFGDVAQVSAGLRDIDHRILANRARTEWRNVMTDEIKHALRRLRRQPAFTIPAILTLALGLGATTAIFTVLDAVVLRPLPYANADRLVYLDTPFPDSKMRWGLARHEMFYFKEASHELEDLGVYQRSMATIIGDGSAATERIPSAYVSSTLLDVLGLKPYVGRLLTPQDNLLADPQVVVLGYEFWQRRFGGDRTIIGKKIPVEGFPLQVVGVIQPGAALPDARADLWVPANVSPYMTPRNNHTWIGVGRLRPGYAAADLRRELEPLVRRFPETFPTVYKKPWYIAVTPLQAQVVGDVVTRALWILVGSVALVFLVAAANVANLFLVRLDARRAELNMRLALGAGRSHLAGHFLAEGLVLSLAAAALGVALAYTGLTGLLGAAPDGIPRLSEVHLGWRSAGVATLLAIVTGVVFAVIPIVGSKLDILALREGSRTLSSSRRRLAIRGALVAGQVALALVLLAAAGLMLKSFQNLRSVRAGFDPTGVITMQVSLPAARYDTDVKGAALFERMATRISALPDVEAVGFGEMVPSEMDPSGCTGVLIEAATREEMKGMCVPPPRVSPGYFSALGIRLDGHEPTWTETDGGAGPAVVTRSLAEKLWPGQNAIGKGIRCCQAGPRWYRVVAVTEDIRGNGFDNPPTDAVFFPMIELPDAPLEGAPRFVNVIVRSRSGNLRALTPAIKRIIVDEDVQVPIANERSMEQVVARSMAKRTFTLTLLAIASVMALILSAIGLYGVVSYVVGERRAEIGIRVALGARRGDVGRMIVMQSMRLALIGVVVGVVAALMTMRFMQSLLFEVRPTDPATLAIVAVTLVLLAAVASWIPARRAMRVDPVEALRNA